MNESATVLSRYLRRRLTEVGIELDDFATAIAEDQIKQKAARYRSAAREIWSSEGEMTSGSSRPLARENQWNTLPSSARRWR